MKQMIEDYLDAIKQLPVSSKYKKEELLIKSKHSVP